MKKVLLITIFILFNTFIYGQKITSQNTLFFLNLPLDARSSAIGDAGIATTPDIYSHQMNAAKYIFGSKQAGLSLSYAPWMRKLVKDMSITGLNGFYKIDSLQTISTSLRYFRMGEITLASEEGVILGKSSAYQMAFDLAYARKLSSNFSMSIAFRYIHSSIYPKNLGYKKGNAFAADLTAYYKKNIKFFNLNSDVIVGSGLTNLGTKISYKENKASDFLPLQFKIGMGLNTNLDKKNSLLVTGELSRILIPSHDEDLDKSSSCGMFSSIKETDLKSLICSFGGEYSFNKILFARFGYFYQNNYREDRQYLTFGAGFIFNIIHFDVSYLATTNSRHNSLANTLRFSIGIDL